MWWHFTIARPEQDARGGLQVIFLVLPFAVLLNKFSICTVWLVAYNEKQTVMQIELCNSIIGITCKCYSGFHVTLHFSFPTVSCGGIFSNLVSNCVCALMGRSKKLSCCWQTVQHICANKCTFDVADLLKTCPLPRCVTMLNVVVLH